MTGELRPSGGSGGTPLPRRWLVTGSAGHLGEALVRTLRERGDAVVGLDRLPSTWTDVVTDLSERERLGEAVAGVDHVLHTATVHKPHVGTHARQDFVDVNVSGTLAVLDAATAAGVTSVVVTSSTSAFGRALTTAPGEPTAWITEDVPHRVRNVYGATKTAAEDLAELAAGDGLGVVVLRTSRFFPEADDDAQARARYPDAALKAIEFLHRRVDLADVVDAHLLAALRAPAPRVRYVVSATTPFTRDESAELGVDAPAVIERHFPELARRFAARGWPLPDRLDRVYDNTAVRAELGWRPRYDFAAMAELALSDGDPRSPLARMVGAKGYHPVATGVYTT